MSNIFRVKCLVIGDSTVGKTSIVKVLSGPPNQFPNKYLMTTDIQVSHKRIDLTNSERSVELFLYDCSGKEFYRQIFEKVWSNHFSLIVAVFDVTNEQSFNSLHKWLSEALKTIGKDKVIGIVLGNKSDLTQRVVVNSDGAHSLAKKYKMRYFECSAKQKVGIEEAFLHLVNAWNELHNNHNNYNTIKDN